MSSETLPPDLLTTLASDLEIQCRSCHKPMLAPVTLIGQLVECPFCQNQFVVVAETPPSPSRSPEIARSELSGMEGQLRENASQITELKGHVSRLNMELHRHQIRMKALTDRQAELQSSIATVRGELGLV